MSNYNIGGLVAPGYLADPAAYVTGSSTTRALSAGQSAPYDAARFTNGAAFTYTISVTNGSHRLILGFLEDAGNHTGQRLFHIDINGVRWLSDVDIYKEAGANTPWTRTIDTQAVGGQITVTVTPHVGNGMLAALMIDQGLTVFEQILNELQKHTALLAEVDTSTEDLATALTPPG